MNNRMVDIIDVPSADSEKAQALKTVGLGQLHPAPDRGRGRGGARGAGQHCAAHRGAGDRPGEEGRRRRQLASQPFQMAHPLGAHGPACCTW
jgi:hypothetical protein